MPANGKDKKTKPLFSAEEWQLLQHCLAQNPIISELPVEVLNIDYSYQTRPRDDMIYQIASQFCEPLLGVLKVSQRPDRTYWIADGATRALAILSRGEKHRLVRCEIYQTEGRQPEALLFAWLNSKRSKKPIKLETNLQAYNVAGTDRGFGKAVEKCGYVLVGGGKRHLHGPGYVKQAWDLDGDGTVMTKTLFAIKDAWKDKYKVYGYMVLGIARVYHYSRKTVDDQVRRVLQRKPPDEIMELVLRRYATAGGKARIHPDDKPRLISRVIVEQINRSPGKSGKIDITKLESDARLDAQA
jgi:hypothetical protein